MRIGGRPRSASPARSVSVGAWRRPGHAFGEPPTGVSDLRTVNGAAITAILGHASNPEKRPNGGFGTSHLEMNEGTETSAEHVLQGTRGDRVFDIQRPQP